MFFPKDEGVGDWKRGKKFEMGRESFLEKTFFKFYWARKHQKKPPFPHAAVFHIPSQFCNGKTFWENQFGIHARANKKK